LRRGKVATFELVVDGQTFTVEVGDVSRSPVTVIVDGVAKSVGFTEVSSAVSAAPRPTEAAPVATPAAQVALAPQIETAPAGSVPGQVVVAPMPGKILSVLVTVGKAVTQGEAVCTLEAMKMEMPITAPAAGTVKAIHVRVGETVANGAPLVTIG
jgi:biotin carboxyl carrier protein